MTKAYAVNSKFDAADMTNAVIDRVDFRKASMRGVKFSNAVITGAFFDGADLTDTDFEDALIGGEDAKRLCASDLFLSYCSCSFLSLCAIDLAVSVWACLRRAPVCWRTLSDVFSAEGRCFHTCICCAGRRAS